MSFVTIPSSYNVSTVGIVKSSVMLTLFQVASRQFVLWGCIVGVPGVSG